MLPMDALTLMALMQLPAGRQAAWHATMLFPSRIAHTGSDLAELMTEMKRTYPLTPLPTKAQAAEGLERAKRVLELCHSLGIDTVCYGKNGYPPLLTLIPNPPVLLYRKGEGPSFDRAVAVVGTGHPDHEGWAASFQAGRALAVNGYTVVSGLARGCDTAAHRGAVAANAPVVAVLACGLDRVYPPDNQDLARQILESGGCILSENPPGTPPLAAHLVARNRIITGISSSVVVGQLGKGRGTRHSVRYAQAQGRNLFCMNETTAELLIALHEAPQVLPEDRDLWPGYFLDKLLLENRDGRRFMDMLPRLPDSGRDSSVREALFGYGARVEPAFLAPIAPFRVGGGSIPLAAPLSWLYAEAGVRLSEEAVFTLMDGLGFEAAVPEGDVLLRLSGLHLSENPYDGLVQATGADASYLAAGAAKDALSSGTPLVAPPRHFGFGVHPDSSLLLLGTGNGRALSTGLEYAGLRNQGTLFEVKLSSVLPFGRKALQLDLSGAHTPSADALRSALLKTAKRMVDRDIPRLTAFAGEWPGILSELDTLREEALVQTAEDIEQSGGLYRGIFAQVLKVLEAELPELADYVDDFDGLAERWQVLAQALKGFTEGAWGEERTQPLAQSLGALASEEARLFRSLMEALA